MFTAPRSGSDAPVAVVDEDISFAFPVGYVRHEVSSDGSMIVNVTIPWRHALNPGIVRRWITETSNRVYIHTYGEGTGILGKMNEDLKEEVWLPVDSSLINWATNERK